MASKPTSNELLSRVDLASLSLPPRDGACRAALRRIEHALLTEGWLRVRVSDLGPEVEAVVAGYTPQPRHSSPGQRSSG